MTNLNELVAAVDEPQNAEKQSKAERAFVARLDLFLLTFGCISQGKYNHLLIIEPFRELADTV